jgi:hypothetical protein
MITNKRNFFSGLILLVIPLLGFPLSLKFFFIFVIAGILIVSSAKMVIPKNFPKQFSRKQYFKERIDDVQGEKPVESVHAVIVEKPMVHTVVNSVAIEQSHSPMHPHHVTHAKPIKEKVVSHKKIDKEVVPLVPVKKTRTRKSKGTDSIPLQ